MSQQGLLQQSIRDITGTALDYNGDWLALMAADSITTGAFNERLLAWINVTLGTSYTNLPEAQQAFAVNQGYTSWSHMGAIVLAQSLARDLFGSETQGLALDFTDDFWQAGTGYYGSAYIVDTGTPANDYDSHPLGLLSASVSEKWTRRSDGVMRRTGAGADLPYEWDLAGNQMGVVVESATTVNDVPASENFSATNWTMNGGARTQEYATAPDGYTTATLLTASVSGSFSSYLSTNVRTVTGSITGSVFVKKGNQRYVFIDLYGGASDYVAVFDLDSAGSYVGNGGWTTSTRRGVEDWGGGWYRLWVSVDSPAANTKRFAVGLATGNNTTSASGDTVVVWGAQFESSAEPSSYIPVKNLLLQSQSFNSSPWLIETATVTDNATTAPDGTQTAAKLEETTGSNNHEMFHSTISIPVGQAHCLSVYAKQGERRYVSMHLTYTNGAGTDYYAAIVVDLQTGTVTETGDTGDITLNDYGIVSVGDGWYRYWLVATGATLLMNSFGISVTNGPTPGFFSLGGTNTYAGTLGSGAYFWGAQLERGTAPTAYNQTGAANNSRAGDVLTLAASDFPHSGTVNSAMIRYRPRNVARAMVALRWDDGTSNEVVSIGHDASANIGLTVTDGGAAQTAPLTSGTATAEAWEKIAVSWKANDFLISDNGAAAAADTSGTVPTITSLDIGPTFSGHISQILIIPVEKSAAEVAAMAT